MIKTYPPIKRSHELSHLSRDHHEGLLFVWKIKQGVVYGIAEKRIGRFCEWFWQNHLEEHMKKEEVALLQILDESHLLIQNMLEDHIAIRTKIEQVIEDSSYYSIQRLAQIIYFHIRFEERVLFTAIEKIATSKQLEDISSVIFKQPEPSVQWFDEFWINPSKIKKEISVTN